MLQAIIMIYMNITNFVLISQLEKYHSMMERHRLKNVVIFFQTILSFVLLRKTMMERSAKVVNIQKRFEHLTGS